MIYGLKLLREDGSSIREDGRVTYPVGEWVDVPGNGAYVAVTGGVTSGGIGPMLAAFECTDATLVAGVTPVKAVHLAELRTALGDVYAAASATPPTYTYPTVIAGATIITAVDIAELRSAVLAIW